MKNYYEILEVNPKASKEIIQKVYKLQIKKNHPDLYQGMEKELADQRVQEFNEAYEVLSDNEKRKEYDDQLKDEDYEINKEIYDSMKEENNQLKQVIVQKQQIIDHFLGNMDLSELEKVQHQASNAANPSKETITKQDMNRYYLTIFLKIFFRIFLLVFVIAMIYFLLFLLKR